MDSRSNSSQANFRDLLPQALSCAANAIFITDSTGRIMWVNEAFCHLSGYSPEEAIGKTPAIVRSGKQSSTFYSELWQTIIQRKVWRGTMIDRRKDGSLYTVDETITPLFDDKGSIIHFLAVNNDITLQQFSTLRRCSLKLHNMSIPPSDGDGCRSAPSPKRLQACSRNRTFHKRLIWIKNFH